MQMKLLLKNGHVIDYKNKTQSLQDKNQQIEDILDEDVQ